MVVAAFDFDGTITRRDTFNAFLAWWFGWPALTLTMARHGRLLAKYARGLASNHEIKEALFGPLVAGIEARVFEDRCRRFAGEAIPGLVRPAALECIRKHLDAGDRVIVVSASIEDWITPWCRAQGIAEVVATRVEVADGKLTGRFSTPACYGQEKVNRLRQILPTDCRLVAYGDSRGDRELLALAHQGFYRAFH